MRIRSGHWLRLVAVITAIGGISSCSSKSATTQPTESSAAVSATHDADAEQRSAGRAAGSIALGDLNRPKDAKQINAPFDPCALRWDDFPAQVRPTDGQAHAPTLRAPGEKDTYDIRCLYDNSGRIKIDPNNPTASGPEGGYFLVSIFWDSTASVDPAKTKGSTAKSWSGRPGLVLRPPDDARTGSKLCLAAVKVGNGAGGVSVTNGRFKDVDPCMVAETLAAAIATKTQ
jgi:hypothetical protein